MITVGILTISDRASRGEYDDRGGPALKEAVAKHGWKVIAEGLVPDEKPRIQAKVLEFEKAGCGLILTTGGTGIAPRDVTPEAVREIMSKELSGFGEVMRARSAHITPHAILSRNMAAVVGRSLVIALPGKPSAAVECLSFVHEAIPHGVELVQNLPTHC